MQPISLPSFLAFNAFLRPHLFSPILKLLVHQETLSLTFFNWSFFKLFDAVCIFYSRDLKRFQKHSSNNKAVQEKYQVLSSNVSFWNAQTLLQLSFTFKYLWLTAPWPFKLPVSAHHSAWALLQGIKEISEVALHCHWVLLAARCWMSLRRVGFLAASPNDCRWGDDCLRLKGGSSQKPPAIVEIALWASSRLRHRHPRHMACQSSSCGVEPAWWQRPCSDQGWPVLQRMQACQAVQMWPNRISSLPSTDPPWTAQPMNDDALPMQKHGLDLENHCNSQLTHTHTTKRWSKNQPK